MCFLLGMSICWFKIINLVPLDKCVFLSKAAEQGMHVSTVAGLYKIVPVSKTDDFEKLLLDP